MNYREQEGESAIGNNTQLTSMSTSRYLVIISGMRSMKKVHYKNLIIVFFFSLIMVVQGCSSQPKWIEYEGQFATKDFKKAQDEIPFTIIMPTYLPYSQQDESIADIQGPLKEYQGDEIETKVKIGNRGIRENLLYF